MELDKNTIKKIIKIIAFAIILFWILNNYILLIGFIQKILLLITPLILGFCIAFILNIPMTKLENIFSKSQNTYIKKVRRPICFLLSLVIIIGVILIIFLLVIPELANTIKVLIDTIPVAVEKVTQWINIYSKDYPAIEEWINSLNLNWNTIQNNILNALKIGVTGFVGSTFSAVTSIISNTINFIVSFIFSIYILMSKEKLAIGVKELIFAYIPEMRAKNILKISSISRNIFTNFIIGQCTEAVIIGVLCFLGMTIFRFPYAPMVGALVGMTALIPVVGAFIGTGVGAFMILMINPLQALWFIVFILILQQLEGNIIYPKVVGTSVGLPAMWVLASVTIGGGLLGIVGMLLSVPVSSIIYTITKEDVKKRLERKNLKI